MKYLIVKKHFYAAWDTMVLMYTQYPAITPVTEEQIKDDLIAYLNKYGYITDDLCSEDDGYTLVNPEIAASLILQDVKEALKHD